MLNLLLVAFISASAAFAQQQSGTLQGKVVDQLGGVLIDAEISLNRTGYQSSTKTNAQGGFAFSGLTPGRYTIRVTADGFIPYENKSVDVTAETRVLSIQLRVGGPNQEVTVTTDLRLSVD